jgi:hypothetical protein
MKPRYRILWDKEIIQAVDFWEIGTKNFFFIYCGKIIQYSIWLDIPHLKQRVGLNN